MGPVIVLDRLTKRYGEVTAVQDVSLQVRPGEIYVLLGANGAGKTTVLRCLATLLAPSAGTARVDGYDVRSEPLKARSRLSFLSASMGLYERLSAREFLRYFAALQGVPDREIERRVGEVTDLFEIRPFENQWCGKLSTGQRQRVSIARAVLHDPPALILDEPTLGLDLLSGRTIYAFMDDARRRGRAILFSTHQMDEVDLLADRVGVLAGGRLIAEGTVPELLKQAGEPSIARAFLSLVEGAV